MPKTHASFYFSSDTYCGLLLDWKDQKAYGRKTGKEIAWTKKRAELTCKSCERASG